MNAASPSDILTTRVVFVIACMLFAGAICFQLTQFGMPVQAAISSVALTLIGSAVVGILQDRAYGGLAAWASAEEGPSNGIPMAQRVFMVLVVCVAFSFVLSVKGVVGAWAQIANAFILTWDMTTDGYVLPLRSIEGFSVVDIAAIALCFSSLISLLVWGLVRLEKSALVLGVMMLIIMASVYCGKASIVSTVMVLGTGIFVVMLMSANVKRAMRSLRDTSLKAALPRFASESLMAMIPAVSVILVVSLAVGIGSSAAIGNWAQAPNMRAQLVQSFNEMRFGSDTLPEGNFSKAHRMNQADGDSPTARLDVAFGSEEALEQTFFRGFIGSDYEGYSFEQPRIEAYDGQWNGLFSWVEGSGFDPMTQNALYVKADGSMVDQQVHASSIEIVAQDANRRYSYAPYQAISVGATDPLLDIYLQPTGFFGLEDEAIDVVPGSQTTESFTPPAWVSASLDELHGDAQSFIQAERAYRSFVYDTYLEVREGTDEAIAEFFFTGEGWDPTTKDLYSTATRIRSMLESHCTFTYEPNAFRASDDADYVKWFLESEKQGNSSAFASAAVLAFREAGIPARYVEGYLLSQANVEALRDAGQTDARLTSREAHAWAEVYIDGVGWTPMEMTPGFYEKDYNTEQTIEISKEVQGDGSDSDLSGSFDRSWNDWIPEQLRPFAWIGLLLLLVIVGLAVFGSMELQRYLRIRARSRRLASAVEHARANEGSRELGLTEIGDVEASAILFARLSAAMRFFDGASVEAPAGSTDGSSDGTSGGLCDVAFDEDRPFECADAVAACIPGVSVAQYRRAIELIERERFGSRPLNSHEVGIVEDVIRRIEDGLWKSSPGWKHPIMRYIHLFELPL